MHITLRRESRSGTGAGTHSVAMLCTTSVFGDGDWGPDLWSEVVGGRGVQMRSLEVTRRGKCS